MTEGNKPFSFPGYTPLAKPRKQARGKEENRGGGLMMGIRNNIPYHEVKDLDIRDKDDGISESQTIEIPLNANETWRITNVYIPSEKTGDKRGSTGDTVVLTKHWPAEDVDMLVGDFNAHSLSWDATLEVSENKRGIEEKRGDMIEEWMLEKDMACLNDGSTTHTNRRTGKESTRCDPCKR